VRGPELTVDARGLACPVPVVRVKQALDSLAGGRVVVLVDDPVAMENVIRLAAHLGCSQRCEREGETFRITIWKPGESGEQ
jgi:TusA-related sulfurtransferase